MFFLLLCIIQFTHSYPLDDLVTHWPGVKRNPRFKIFSGYLDPTPTKHLHYVFLYSQHSFAEDPVLVWFNGGPGCSSMDGLLYEHGPFLVNRDGRSFTENQWSWNKVANVLYIESPIGVGFSYSDDNHYHMNDEQTAVDNANALDHFLQKFPEFIHNDFFVAGESYAGIYVPMLALEIMRRGTATKVKLKGFAVGNGLSNYRLNDNSLMFFAYNHGLIPDNLWEEMITRCCGGVASAKNCEFHSSPSMDCKRGVSKAMSAVYSSGVNFYNLYGECLSSNAYQRSLDNIFDNLDMKEAQYEHLKLQKEHYDEHEVRLRKSRTKVVATVNNTDHMKLQKVHTGSVPCIDARGATLWLRNREVMKALHVRHVHWKWEICSSVLNYSRQKRSMEHVYRELLENYNLRGVNYNGDTDMACNFLGNEWFVNTLGRPVKEDWHQWSVPNSKQVAGFMMEYDLLKFYTVKGAGHMVPQWAPEESMYILIDFLYGDKPDESAKAKRAFWGNKGNAGMKQEFRVVF